MPTAFPLVEELVPAPDPADVCERLASLPYRVFLDSAAGPAVTGPNARLGRYSFLSADPALLVRSKGLHTECVRLDAARGPLAEPVAGNALDVVRALLAAHATAPLPGLPPFQGGAAGYIGYDWGAVLERLPAPRYDDLAIPDVMLGIYDWAIGWDHAQRRAWVVSTGIPERAAPARERRAAERLRAVLRAVRGSDAVSRGGPSFGGSRYDGSGRGGAAHDDPSRGGTMVQDRDGRDTIAVGGGPPLGAYPNRAAAQGARGAGARHAPSYPLDDVVPAARAIGLRSSFTHRGYLDAVTRVRDYIVAGDIFQANLSQRLEAPLREHPWSLYRRLRALNPAPFAAYLDFGDAVVASASPERFLGLLDGRTVEARPIKGTRPRGTGPEHDAALGQALLESAKDRAENLMIVDLLRNDLSRVCRGGTVHVPELFALERYSTVHHLVSTVVGELAPGADAADLLAATFPGGSITGAPKIRAMEIIAELEPSRRGVYCGSVGYWSVTGALDTSIVIRTYLARTGPDGAPRVYFSVGGGIVADSDPEEEYVETLTKARALIAALEQGIHLREGLGSRV
jgi:para-aminobenzoate synthetase component 1